MTQMIAIVDDDEDVRDSLCSLLQSAGYATRAYASAQYFLSDFDPAIDCAILDHALGLARGLARHGIVAAVGASVDFATLSDPRGRIAYREALRAAHAREQSYLVIKIEDVPEYATAKRIGELVASLRTGSRQVATLESTVPWAVPSQ